MGQIIPILRWTQQAILGLMQLKHVFYLTPHILKPYSPGNLLFFSRANWITIVN